MGNLPLLIGKRIKDLRAQTDYSQEGLALKADIDRTYMTDVENGRRNISINILQKICIALEVSLKDFFDDKMFEGGK